MDTVLTYSVDHVVNEPFKLIYFVTCLSFYIPVGNVDLRIDEAQRPREASSNHPSTQEVFKTVSTRGPGRRDTSYLSDLDETWSD